MSATILEIRISIHALLKLQLARNSGLLAELDGDTLTQRRQLQEPDMTDSPAITAARKLTALYPNDFVAIGSVACCLLLHVEAPGRPHELFGYLSGTAFAKLRALESLTWLPRLSRYTLLIGDADVELYVDGEHNQAVAHADLIKTSRVISGIRVAAPAHVLCLTIDAGLRRGMSYKGKLDWLDCAALSQLVQASTVDGQLFEQYASPERHAYIQASRACA